MDVSTAEASFSCGAGEAAESEEIIYFRKRSREVGTTMISDDGHRADGCGGGGRLDSGSCSGSGSTGSINSSSGNSRSSSVPAALVTAVAAVAEAAAAAMAAAAATCINYSVPPSVYARRRMAVWPQPAGTPRGRYITSMYTLLASIWI